MSYIIISDALLKQPKLYLNLRLLADKLFVLDVLKEEVSVYKVRDVKLVAALHHLLSRSVEILQWFSRS